MKPERNWEIQTINSKNISIDPVYQRRYRPEVVRKILKEFDPNKVNIIKVSYRDGKYWVFDGQHTLRALEKRNGGRPLNVECKVYYGLTQWDEFELFLAQNGATAAVTPLDKFVSRAKMGEPTAVEMTRVLEANGFHVGAHNGPYTVAAIRALESAYQALPIRDFAEMFEMINKAWGGDEDSTKKEILSGLTQFLKLYGCEIDKRRLVKVLSQVPPKKIVMDGKAMTYGGAKRYARAILDLYNYRKKDPIPMKL